MANLPYANPQGPAFADQNYGQPPYGQGPYGQGPFGPGPMYAPVMPNNPMASPAQALAPGLGGRMPTRMFVEDQAQKAVDSWRCEFLQAVIFVFLVWYCYDCWVEFRLMTCEPHDPATWFVFEIIALCLLALLKFWAGAAEYWWTNNEEFQASVLHSEFDHDASAQREMMAMKEVRNHYRRARAASGLLVLGLLVLLSVVGIYWSAMDYTQCNPDLIQMLRFVPIMNCLGTCCLCCHFGVMATQRA